tara:strand:+ start:19950 stop:20864 length:915 start_codon:yes stop_codon:yes gene_type:complete
MASLKLYIGYYGINNIGDDLMLYYLTRKEPEKSYIFLQGKNYYDFIDEKNQIFVNSKNPLFILLFQLIFLINLKIKGLSEIIFGGGTQFSDNSTYFTKLKQLILLIFCKILFIKVSAESVGIGKINKKYGLLNIILKMMDEISVRDQTSSNKLYFLNIRHSLKKDIVYNIKFKNIKKKKNKILITGTGSVLKLNKSYLDSYINFILKNIKINSLDIIFCVFQKDQDEFLFEELKKNIPNLKICFLEMDLNKISNLYSQTKYVIGMRYHSLILADIFNIPFSGFSYDDKVKDLCYLKNMPFYKAL